MRNDGPDYDEVGYSIATNGTGTVYVAGSSSETASFLDYTLFAYQESGTGVNTSSTFLREFSLSQNFPNPFNPLTNISFTLPSRSFVSLKVFDLIGREVAVLVSEELSAGNHMKQWNAENMPSGVYFYRLNAGTYAETKKLILLK